jgi:hypothetical protein
MDSFEDSVDVAMMGSSVACGRLDLVMKLCSAFIVSCLSVISVVCW